MQSITTISMATVMIMATAIVTRVTIRATKGTQVPLNPRADSAISSASMLMRARTATDMVMATPMGTDIRMAIHMIMVIRTVPGAIPTVPEDILTDQKRA